jgi:ABC-type lipoprotein export system ATPase subunit
MISAVDVTKSYPGKSGIIAALDGVSFQVKVGDFVAVIGRSGTGKSTLLGVMGGLLKPSSGEVFLDGESIWELDERLRARLRAQKHGFVFQNASVISSLTVLENVLLPQAFLPQPTVADLSRAMNLVELTGLGSRLHAYPDQLSGGEKRRVAIASALMNDPPLLLADEPTGDLDSETESEIMNLFLNLWRSGKTIVMVTHSHQLASYANRVFKMDGGRILELPEQNGAERYIDCEPCSPREAQMNVRGAPRP